MLKEMTVRLALAAAVTMAASGPAFAQQTLNFNVGYFSVLGEDARTGADCSNCGRDVDVLIADNDFLTFDIGDFNGATIGGEWLIARRTLLRRCWKKERISNKRQGSFNFHYTRPANSLRPIPILN